jgi:hypothetical protein
LADRPFITPTRLVALQVCPDVLSFLQVDVDSPCINIFHYSFSRREYPEVFTESSAGGDEIHAIKAPMAFNHSESPHLHEVQEVLDE